MIDRFSISTLGDASLDPSVGPLLWWSVVIVGGAAWWWMRHDESRRRHALQPATSAVLRHFASPRRLPALVVAMAHASPLVVVLRAAGLARRPAPQPVVGRNAYVRWWERLRAAVVLTAMVVGLGIALAAAIGVVILGAGFFLEQAIS